MRSRRWGAVRGRTVVNAAEDSERKKAKKTCPSLTTAGAVSLSFLEEVQQAKSDQRIVEKKKMHEKFKMRAYAKIIYKKLQEPRFLLQIA